MILLRAMLLAALAFLLPALARAELLASPFVEFREARVRLLGLRTPEGRFAGGLEIQLEPGFKTYWKFAGDSGVPPQFDFSGSTGFRNAEVGFPLPHAFDDGAGGKAYGYTHSVILPIDAQADAGARIALKLDFAVCGTLCIPLNAQLALEAATALPVEAAVAKALAQSRAGLPKPLGPEGMSLKRLPGAGEFALILPYAGDVGTLGAFPDAPGFFEVKAVRPVAGGAEILLKGEPAPGKTTLGPLRLTYGTPEASFERVIDVDAARP